MPQHESSELIRQLREHVETHKRLDGLDRYLSPHFVNHGLPPGTPPNREGFQKFYQGLFKAFPDLRVETHHLIADGEFVAVQKTFHGTHQGSFMHVPRTGRRVAISASDIFQLKDGVVIEQWSVIDYVGLMTQLGVINQSEARGMGARHE